MIRRRPLATTILAVLVPVALVLGIFLGGHPDSLPSAVRDALVSDHGGRLFDEAVDEVMSDYYRQPAETSLVNAGVSGMVASLDDRYSHYFTPDQFRSFQRQTEAEFVGIGVEVRQNPRGLSVVHVYPNSPAQRVGLHAGDVIVRVEGTSLAGKSSQASSALIKGREGTKVQFAFVRHGHRRRVTATRATVSVPVVASKLRTLPHGGPKVAQVALSTFSSGAHGELRAAIDKRLHQGAKGIVLDLRHNGGGLVEEARLVASIFIPEGPIVTTRGRSQPTRTLMAAGDAIPSRIPVAVLVDGETASAAEIVAGALQDRHRATIVGTPTFGKGVFQQIARLSNGGALDITVGQYFLPSGRNLGGTGVQHGAGIQPDVHAADDPHTPGDEAVTAALRVLGRRMSGR